MEKQDWIYVKYAGEVGGGLSVGIKVDLVMRSRRRIQTRLKQNVKQIYL